MTQHFRYFLICWYPKILNHDLITVTSSLVILCSVPKLGTHNCGIYYRQNIFFTSWAWKVQMGTCIVYIIWIYLSNIFQPFRSILDAFKNLNILGLISLYGEIISKGRDFGNTITLASLYLDMGYDIGLYMVELFSG